MENISILGVDLAKASFTICGLDVKGKKVLEREMRPDKFNDFLNKNKKTTIILEACSGAHYWSQRGTEAGHETKLIAPQKVVPYRKTNKNDRNDAFAICVAALSPGMEFVPTKKVCHQELQAVLRNRECLISNQTSLVNYIRGILAEFGVSVPVGIQYIRAVLSEISNRSKSSGGYQYEEKLPQVTLSLVDEIQKELLASTDRIEAMDRVIEKLTAENETCQKLLAIPGVGPNTAAAVVSSLINPSDFKNGRQYSASVGLTPKHVQTGGKDSKPIVLGISKCGNAQIRYLLVQGAMSTINAVKNRRKKMEIELPTASVLTPEPQDKTAVPNSGKKNALHPARKPVKTKSQKKSMSLKQEDWILRLVEEKGIQKAAVALANKTARMIWAISKSGNDYKHDMAYSAER